MKPDGAKLGAAVLCGGRSSRMGRPKALLPWRGRTLIEEVVGILRRVVDEVVVVGSPLVDLPPLDARVVTDREPGLGPLGGIREALEAAEADLVYVTSTDAPFLTPEFVKRVLSFGTAAAPEVDGYIQSLAAAYPRELAALANDLIDRRRMRPLHLLESAGYRKIRPEELPDLDSLRSFNTPEEYLDALRVDGARGKVVVELLGLSRQRAGVSRMESEAGRLEEILMRVQERFPGLALLDGGTLADHLLFSLNGRTFVRDARVAMGPGDRLIVLDAAVGG